MQGIHTAFAYLGGPTWLLSDEDAKIYATSIQNVARHYDIAATQKTIDICNLVGMVCYFEGTRFMAMRQARRQPPPQQRPLAPVFTFSPPPQPASTPSPAHDDPQAGEGALH